MMKISHGLEFVALWSLTKTVQVLPGRVADLIAVGIGKLAYFILASRRRIAQENLRRAFPNEISEQEITKIVRTVFINVARTTIEFARQPIMKPDEILKSTISHIGVEYLDRVLSEGKGAMLVTGHVGNWELLGGWLAAKGYPVDFLVGHQHNELVNELFLTFRRSFGAGIIPIGVAARHVIKSLRANRMVVVASDQHSASGGVAVNFMGRPASTPKGPAAFAVKVGSPLIFGYLAREKYNCYRVEFFPPIYPAGSDNAENDIFLMTQAYAAILESIIRKRPDQWMWTHRRWKLD